jgi:hypothetical protein
MSSGFARISFDRYVDLHLKSNPGTTRGDLVQRLSSALKAHMRGDRCQCGGTIWVIGSAEAGHACFSCITGEAMPDQDYEIHEALDHTLAQPLRASNGA